MATVNLMQSKRSQSKAGLKFILSYCKRDSKTVCGDKKLIGGVNCVAESAYHEMLSTKMRYGKTDGRMFYHLVQSFSPEENITPETAHEIALRFAEEQFHEYEVLVATHTDKAHIHSHFIINSVSCENGYKVGHRRFLTFDIFGKSFLKGRTAYLLHGGCQQFRGCGCGYGDECLRFCKTEAHTPWLKVRYGGHEPFDAAAVWSFGKYGHCLFSLL